MLQIEPFWQNYIDGAWCEGGAARIAVTDPATGQVLAEQALADAADVDRAVKAAQPLHLSSDLSGLRPVERGRMMQAMGRYLLAHIDEISPVLTLEQGRPLWEARMEVEGAARYFEYYGNQAETIEDRYIPLGRDYFGFTTYEPFGVSARIIPWNYPIEMTARSFSAALATGNAIATAAARNVVPCVLEPGGKSAVIVHEDADLDAFEYDIRWGIFFNTGQVCPVMSRVIVYESRREELVERAVKVARSLSVGPGIERPDSGVNIGAMVSGSRRDRAAEMVQIAQSQGAGFATGGHPLNRQGAFMEPTILTSVAPEMDTAHQEVFGPVLSILSFRDDAEAIAIANGTEHGLVGEVFTRDLDRATSAARQIRAEQITVNEWYAGGVEAPFGGYGISGYGREKGREALWNYVQSKNVAIRRDSRFATPDLPSTACKIGEGATAE